MKTMFSFILVCSVLFFLPKAGAQDKTSYHLGFVIESLYPTVSNHLTYRNVGFMLRKVHKSNKAWRFQLMHRVRDFAHPIESTMWLQDTLKTSRLREREQTIFFGTGYDVSRVFYKRLSLTASIDMRLGYGWGNFNRVNEYSILNLQKQEMENVYYESAAIPSYRSRSYNLDVLPSIGARIPMRRFTVSAEMGFMIHHAILSRKKVSTETIFDFDMSGVYHRLWLTYRL